jgi:hypothetical protein
MLTPSTTRPSHIRYVVVGLEMTLPGSAAAPVLGKLVI